MSPPPAPWVACTRARHRATCSMQLCTSKGCPAPGGPAKACWVSTKKFEVWGFAACLQRKRGEGGGGSPNPAPKLLLHFTISRAASAAPATLPSLAPTAGGTLPALRLPSVCLSLCPFCLLAVSSGWTISSKLIVTALGSVLKSMVPIRAWPGRQSSCEAAAAPSCCVCFPPLERQARSPPGCSTSGLALPTAP